MYRYLQIIVLSFTLIACTKTVIPETGLQLQTVSYAQIINITNEVYDACQSKVISKETCIDLFDNIKTAKDVVDSGVGAEKAADMINYIRSKL